MVGRPERLGAIAQDCITLSLWQRREEREWNAPPPELADIVSAQAAAHEVDQAARAERVRAAGEGSGRAAVRALVARGWVPLLNGD